MRNVPAGMTLMNWLRSQAYARVSTAVELGARHGRVCEQAIVDAARKGIAGVANVRNVSRAVEILWIAVRLHKVEQAMAGKRATFSIVGGAGLVDVPDEQPTAGQLGIEAGPLSILDQEVLTGAADLDSTRIGQQTCRVRSRFGRWDLHAHVLGGQIGRCEPPEQRLAPGIVMGRGVGQVDR